MCRDARQREHDENEGRQYELCISVSPARVLAESSFPSVRYSFNHLEVLADRGKKMKSKQITSIGTILAGLTILFARTAPAGAVFLIVDGGDQYTLSTGESVTFDVEFIGYSVMTPTVNVFRHNGGSNTTDSLVLGLSSGTIGSYELWSGTLLTTNDAHIGNGGEGSFHQWGGTSTIHTLTLGDGVYNLRGGTVNVGHTVNNSAGHGRLFIDGGTFNNGILTRVDEFQVGGYLNGSFELLDPLDRLYATDVHVGNDATGVFIHGAAQTAISNDLHLGYGVAGVGTLSIIDGGLVSVGGVLTVDLNGGADSSVNMGAGGMLVLAGNGGASLGDFLDLVSGTDAIRYWDPSAWEWADITGAGPGDYTLTEDGAGRTTLTVTAPTPSMLGDTNGDCIVEGTDYADLIAQLGGGPGDQSADFNRDGFVNLEDFAIMRRNFRAGAGLAAAPEEGVVASIPEPASLILMAAGLPLLLRIKRGGGRPGGNRITGAPATSSPPA